MTKYLIEIIDFGCKNEVHTNINIFLTYKVKKILIFSIECEEYIPAEDKEYIKSLSIKDIICLFQDKIFYRKTEEYSTFSFIIRYKHNSEDALRLLDYIEKDKIFKYLENKIECLDFQDIYYNKDLKQSFEETTRKIVSKFNMIFQNYHEEWDF